MVYFGRRRAGSAVLVAVAAAASAAAAPDLPAEVVSRWDAAGDPTGTMAAATLLVGGPALVAGVAVVFEVLPRIDPLGENVAAFRDAYDAAAVTVAGFLAYAHLLVLGRNLGYGVPIPAALAPAVAVLYVVVGAVVERAEPNWFVGVRTPWTLSSDAVWRETHALAGTLFKAAGVVALAAAAFPSRFVVLVAGPAAATALVTTVYSFLSYRRQEGAPADA